MKKQLYIKYALDIGHCLMGSILLELRIGVPPFLSCIHIGRALIVGVSKHGDHCKDKVKDEDKLDKDGRRLPEMRMVSTV